MLDTSMLNTLMLDTLMLNTLRTRTLVLLVALAVTASLVVVAAAGATAPERAATPASGGCGRTATSGVTTQHVTVGGVEREYQLSIPADYHAARPAPLLFDFHGLGSNMQEQALYTGLADRGGAREYVVVTPNGQGDRLRHWSLMPSTTANPDVAFVQEMLRTTNHSLCIAPTRVFATGISNGAMFSTVLACALPGRFAAIAPVSGVNATGACAAGTPRVSVLAFHGTADPIVPYQGGDYFSGAAPARTAGRAQAKPVDDAIAAWAAFDGCGTPASTAFVADDVRHLVWPRCPRNGAVQLYRVIAGGHTWPGAVAVRAERLGATTTSIDATTLILNFFDAHPRRP
jgi:polyhydroxybutyrate depolymerase